MGIFFGILCVICFCLLSAKAVTARLPLKNMDQILMKLHKPASAFLIIACFIHIICVVPLLKNRNVLVVISGIANLVFMVLLIYLCHTIKDKNKNLLWHRIMTIFMAIGIIGHLTAYIINFNGDLL